MINLENRLESYLKDLQIRINLQKKKANVNDRFGFNLMTSVCLEKVELLYNEYQELSNIVFPAGGDYVSWKYKENRNLR